MLSIPGYYCLAQVAPALLPDLSEEQIRDRSKASSLAKTLVFLHAA